MMHEQPLAFSLSIDSAAARAVLDALPEIIHVYDSDWRWLHINPAAAAWLRSLGREPTQLLGRCVWDEFGGAPESSPHYAAALTARQEQREVLYESRVADREYTTRILPYLGGVVSFTRDVTDRRKEERRRLFAAEAGALFAESLTPEEVLTRLVRLAACTAGDFSVAYLIRDRRLQRIATSHVDPERALLLETLERVAPLDVDRPVFRQMFETREPLLMHPPDASAYATGPEHERIIRALAPQSAVTVPIEVQGDRVGLLTIGTSAGGHPPLDAQDAMTIGEIARRAGLGLALERSRRRAEATAQRLAQFQRATATLARALPMHEVLDAIITLAVEETGAFMGAIYEVSQDEAEFVLLGHSGLGAELAVRYARVPVATPLPIGDAARLREPVFLQDRSEWLARYTIEPTRDGVPVVDGAWAVVPLIAEERLVGALTLSFPASRPFDAGDREYLTALAAQCAHALDRARLHTQVREKLQAAEAASQAKSQFLAVISHELRTPLTAVIGVTDLLSTEVWGALNERQKEQLGRVKASAWHLVGIIDEILTFSRAEAGKEEVSITTVQATDLVREVVSLLEPHAAARNLHLRATMPAAGARLRTDGGKLRQILVNLVGNAVKFTDSGEIDVVVECDNSGVVIHIRDTGIGIGSEFHERIFEPFWQVDQSSTRAQGGTGLGLPVCRRLARLLGGDVTLSSEVGAGSTFTLRLPSR